MLVHSATCTRIIAVRLNTNDDLLLSLRKAVQEQQIRDAVILSGIGSIQRYHVHVVATAQLPPRDEFIRGEGPYDILTVTGAILDGRVHAHLTFSNQEKAMGGHLEEGCHVLTFAIVILAEAPGISMSAWDSWDNPPQQ